MIERETVVVRDGDLVTAPMGADLAMMDMDSGTYFVLDGVGAAIWDAIEEPVAVSAICGQLVERFDVDDQRCEADVIGFLEQLAAKRLLRVADGGSGPSA